MSPSDALGAIMERDLEIDRLQLLLRKQQSAARAAVAILRAIPVDDVIPRAVAVVDLDDACDGCGVIAGGAVIFAAGGPALCFGCLDRAVAEAKRYRDLVGQR